MKRVAYKSILGAIVVAGTFFGAGGTRASAQIIAPIVPPYPTAYVAPVAPVVPYYAPYGPGYYGWSGRYWRPGFYGRPWGGYVRPFGPRYYRGYGPFLYGRRWY